MTIPEWLDLYPTDLTCKRNIPTTKRNSANDAMSLTIYIIFKRFSNTLFFQKFCNIKEIVSVFDYDNLSYRTSLKGSVEMVFSKFLNFTIFILVLDFENLHWLRQILISSHIMWTLVHGLTTSKLSDCIDTWYTSRLRSSLWLFFLKILEYQIFWFLF